MNNAEIKMMFKLMEYDYLTEPQENLIVSFELQFNSKGYLSEKQQDILSDIFKRAAEKVEWSR